MDTNTHASRRDSLRQTITSLGLDGLLVSHAANRYYLSGFELHDPQCNESAGLLLILPDGDDYLLTDPRYKDAALRLWPEDKLFIYSGKPREMIRTFLADKVSGDLGFESKAMSVDLYSFLSGPLTLKATVGLVEDQRLIKDETELLAMARSCKVNHQVFDRLPEILAPGKTEAAVAWEIEKLFRELGASELAFPPIVAVDQNAALPHAIPGERTISNGCLVLIDIGGRFQEYCSDQTRTFWVGDTPSDRFLNTRDMVQEAQLAAMEAMRPGMRVSEAYAVAQKSFEKHGVAEAFTHALGHGIGLETHEPPSLGLTSPSVLKPGMVVTVEPGLYYPDWGGIRWEYMVRVTENGVTPL